MAFTRAIVIGYVYKLCNIVNGKQYIGCTTTSVEKRWRQHQQDATNGCIYALHKALRKYGPLSFEVSTLEVVKGPYSDLLLAEIAWIAHFKCVAPKGYNLTHGGQGIDFSVPEVRSAQLEGSRLRSTRPEWRLAQSKAKKSLHQDPAFKERHRAGLLRATRSEGWLEAATIRNRAQAEDSEWRAALVKGIALRSQSPVWYKALLGGAKKRVVRKSAAKHPRKTRR